ncbi:hypothetical protein LMH87_007188 [Akanthomyces muscarius]|uniref:Uncharacterized protein n=1 Tax=Akanthomyces muscarius TaxID=2231603 RepID=A0A9W8QR34_AKAMU|nr:hypothetical protein LMH87_007188 [Akanthomyces muscarius]KAJ4165560.1 hypothetical protein LMH87_007188 [Akanthomyces muscarius]
MVTPTKPLLYSKSRISFASKYYFTVIDAVLRLRASTFFSHLQRLLKRLQRFDVSCAFTSTLLCGTSYRPVRLRRRQVR